MGPVVHLSLSLPLLSLSSLPPPLSPYRPPSLSPKQLKLRNRKQDWQKSWWFNLLSVWLCPEGERLLNDRLQNSYCLFLPWPQIDIARSKHFKGTPVGWLLSLGSVLLGQLWHPHLFPCPTITLCVFLELQCEKLGGQGKEPHSFRQTQSRLCSKATEVSLHGNPFLGLGPLRNNPKAAFWRCYFVSKWPPVPAFLALSPLSPLPSLILS